MFDSIPRLSARDTRVKQLRDLRAYTETLGYRTPTEADIIAGTELFMVHFRDFMSRPNQPMSGSSAGCLMISLCNPPTRPVGRTSTRKLVCYEWVSPRFGGQCFVSVEEFCAVGYLDSGAYPNEYLYAIKIKA